MKCFRFGLTSSANLVWTEHDGLDKTL